MPQFKRTSIAVLTGVAFVTLAATGCATKKYVRQQVDPVTGRVTTVEKSTAKNTGSIGELENNVSQVNEKALGADKKAEQAGQSAQQANQAAQEANQLAMNAKSRADEVGANADRRFSDVDKSLQNIDNFQQLSTESILFGFNKSVLTPDAKSKLDQMVTTLQSQGRYVVEIEGFADRSGSANYNLGLSAKRADAVVRYLTLQHNIPLRRIHVLGAGEVERDQQKGGREARKMARRVDVKVFGPSMSAVNGSTRTDNTADRSMPASTQTRTPQSSQDLSNGTNQVPRQ